MITFASGVIIGLGLGMFLTFVTIVVIEEVTRG